MLITNIYYNGDWGLGIGDWAQSPIPNPQSPNSMIIIRNYYLSRIQYLNDYFYLNYLSIN